jgi:hypothetical protein
MGSGAENNTRIKNDKQFFPGWMLILPWSLPGRRYAKPADPIRSDFTTLPLVVCHMKFVKKSQIRPSAQHFFHFTAGGLGEEKKCGLILLPIADKVTVKQFDVWIQSAMNIVYIKIFVRTIDRFFLNL